MDALSVSVVLLVLDDVENVPHLLPRIPAWVDEVLLVERQPLGVLLPVARAMWPNVRVVAQQGADRDSAARAGSAEAAGDIIVVVDGDGSADPAEIPAVLGALLAGADWGAEPP